MGVEADYHEKVLVMMAWELKQIIMRRMSDDGGGECSIVTGGEIGIFFFACCR